MSCTALWGRSNFLGDRGWGNRQKMITAAGTGDVLTVRAGKLWNISGVSGTPAQSGSS